MKIEVPSASMVTCIECPSTWMLMVGRRMACASLSPPSSPLTLSIAINGCPVISAVSIRLSALLGRSGCHHRHQLPMAAGDQIPKIRLCPIPPLRPEQQRRCQWNAPRTTGVIIADNATANATSSTNEIQSVSTSTFNAASASARVGRSGMVGIGGGAISNSRVCSS